MSSTDMPVHVLRQHVREALPLDGRVVAQEVRRRRRHAEQVDVLEPVAQFAHAALDLGPGEGSAAGTRRGVARPLGDRRARHGCTSWRPAAPRFGAAARLRVAQQVQRLAVAVHRADVDVRSPARTPDGAAALLDVGVDQRAHVLVAPAAFLPQRLEFVQHAAGHLERAPDPVGLARPGA
jgi:hypothetical protein